MRTLAKETLETGHGDERTKGIPKSKRPDSATDGHMQKSRTEYQCVGKFTNTEIHGNKSIERTKTNPRPNPRLQLLVPEMTKYFLKADQFVDNNIN